MAELQQGAQVAAAMELAADIEVTTTTTATTAVDAAAAAQVTPEATGPTRRVGEAPVKKECVFSTSPFVHSP